MEYKAQQGDLADVMVSVFEENSHELSNEELMVLAKKEIKKREKDFNETWVYEEEVLLKSIEEEREEVIKEKQCEQFGHNIQYETEEEGCNTIICTKCRFLEDVVSVNSRGY